MRARRTLLNSGLAIGLLLAGAPAVEAQDLAGSWRIALRGCVRGAMQLSITERSPTEIEVTGYGITLGLGEFFEVPPQTLTADRRKVLGTIGLEDESGAAIAALDWLSGGVTEGRGALQGRGALTARGITKCVRLRGRRTSEHMGVLAGRGERIRSQGDYFRARRYNLVVAPDRVLNGFPAFEFRGLGDGTIRGTPTRLVTIEGRVIVDHQHRVWGRFESRDLGAGTLKGRLRPLDEIPHVRMKSDTLPPFKIRGPLPEAISPIIAVSPTEIFDFGVVPAGDTSEPAEFTVTNLGVGTLTGTATVDDDVFKISGADYSVPDGDTATVAVTFEPEETGQVGGVLSFSGGGGAERALAGRGDAAQLTVDVPEDGVLDFGEVEVGSSAQLTITVTNSGDAPISGLAEVDRATERAGFLLLDDDPTGPGQVPVPAIPFELDKEQSLDFEVVFAPTDLELLAGSVEFNTGEPDEFRLETVPLTGTGVEPDATP
ncbi:MAG: choice-of-anchor D domain-containing protein [Myxococcota bacterium]|nr:choice-of-anchor D domain-containing protein [Myxococcota bacterium]